ENDLYDVPTPTLGNGGGTIRLSSEDTTKKFEPPAIVKVEHKKVYAAMAVYRIAVPRYECEVAANKPEYFNYLFDKIVFKAIANYNATFGGSDKIRFGSHYCSCYNGEGPDGIFLDLDGGDLLEFRLHGKWASDKEVPKITLPDTTNEVGVAVNE